MIFSRLKCIAAEWSGRKKRICYLMLWLQSFRGKSIVRMIFRVPMILSAFLVRESAVLYRANTCVISLPAVTGCVGRLIRTIHALHQAMQTLHSWLQLLLAQHCSSLKIAECLTYHLPSGLLLLSFYFRLHSFGIHPPQHARPGMVAPMICMRERYQADRLKTCHLPGSKAARGVP